MLLTSLPSSYEKFAKTLLYERESLTIEDVLPTLSSRELKERTKDTKEETGDGLYVRGRSDHSGKAHSGGSSRFKSRGGTGKLKCFICHSEIHLKRDCLMKKSSWFIKKGKHDQDSDSFDDEGNAYFREAVVVVGNDEMAELVMDSGGSYHMTHRSDFLYDFKDVDGGSVQLGDNRTCTIKGTEKVKIQLHDGSSFILKDDRYVQGLRRSLISLGTLKKEGYTVKMQMGTIKVIKGCSVMMTRITKRNCVYFGSKSDDFWWTKAWRFKTSWIQTNWLKNMFGLRWNCRELKEIANLRFFKEKVHLGIKVGTNIMVTEVSGQEGAEDNVAEKKKVKESMKANLEKLLKYNAWSTRWSPI
ncbi:zinc finger, CCHC-type containing protein [Tanacetum coccineum]